jgi:hypothetical protein
MQFPDFNSYQHYRRSTEIPSYTQPIRTADGNIGRLPGDKPSMLPGTTTIARLSFKLMWDSQFSCFSSAENPSFAAIADVGYRGY